LAQQQKQNSDDSGDGELAHAPILAGSALIA
jgi:hypothetical protein